MGAKETAEHRSAFEFWYDNDRHFARTAAHAAVTEKSVYEWANKFDWRTRADARDADLERISHKAAVGRQKALIDKERKAGEALRLRGIEFLSKREITRASDAIKAITAGIEMERRAEGMPAYLLDLTTQTEDELQIELARLLRIARSEGSSGDAGVGAEEDGPSEESCPDNG